MSKQSEAKIQQGYIPKIVPQSCSNCASFQSDKVPQQRGMDNQMYNMPDRNLRCGIGGFKVMKMGTCDVWSGNP